MSSIHCGACGAIFQTTEELSCHLERCIGARTLLPFVVKVWIGKDSIGHPTAGIISAFPEAGHLLRRYAMAVSMDLDILERTRLHRKLCDKLRVKYEDFRPFEADGIETIPTYLEAERMLWLALEQLLLSFSK